MPVKDSSQNQINASRIMSVSTEKVGIDQDQDAVRLTQSLIQGKNESSTGAGVGMINSIVASGIIRLIKTGPRANCKECRHLFSFLSQVYDCKDDPECPGRKIVFVADRDPDLVTVVVPTVEDDPNCEICGYLDPQLTDSLQSCHDNPNCPAMKYQLAVGRDPYHLVINLAEIILKQEKAKGDDIQMASLQKDYEGVMEVVKERSLNPLDIMAQATVLVNEKREEKNG